MSNMPRLNHGDATYAALEARLESAGRRLSAYLRHVPLPERTRHELTLKVLHVLADDPDSDRAEARAMRILHSLLEEEKKQGVTVIPAMPLVRSHMKPEEMDRRPWVRVALRIWQPTCIFSTRIMNTTYADIVLYALLLLGLYVMADRI
jgi:hypothetical protein